MAAELEEHIALRTEHLMARGLSQEAAERQARARFGHFPTARRQLLLSARQREGRMDRRERLQDLKQDIRLAWRMARRAPGFYLGTILTLALGVGANGAVFSILHATLLEPLPYRAPGDVVAFWRAPKQPPPTPPGSLTAERWRGILTSVLALNWRNDSTNGLTDLALALNWRADREAQFDLVLPDRAERLRGGLVTPNFFELLGVSAVVGRVFGLADEPSGAPLLVLSHSLWIREFGGDPGIVGRSVTLTVGSSRTRERRAFTVTGVLSPAFRFTYPQETEAWAMMPWSAVASWDPRAIAFFAIGRLRPGRTLAQVAERAAAFAVQFERSDTPPALQQTLEVEPIREWVTGSSRPALYLLGGVALTLLLVACVTVANGFLVRLSERQQDLSLRAALGARRSRLVRQVLTEGALISAGGVGAGTILALLLQPALRRFLPAAFPRVGDIGADPAILGFAAATAAVTTLLAALLPALGGTARSGATRLGQRFGAASASRAAVRWRQGLITCQAALATILLVSASLLLTSFFKLGRVSLGFDGTEVLTAEMRLIDRRYYTQPFAQLQDRLLAAVRGVPGVASAALTTAVPFRGVDYMMNYQRTPTDERKELANVRTVDRAYFEVLDIPLRGGRLFSEIDGQPGPPVMVVSEAFAHKMFGSENPVGKTVVAGADSPPVEIIGVVGDVRYVRLDRDPRPAVYLTRSQGESDLICLLVRATSGPVDRLAPAIRAAIHGVDPDLPTMDMTTIDRIIDESVADRRFYTGATTAFATLALLLTVVGLGVVVTRIVTERKRELAIRAALGASFGRLIRRTSGESLAAVGLGVAAGLGGGFAISSVLQHFLFQVDSRSPLLYAGVALLVIGVAAAAAWWSSRRLGQFNLAELLRAD
ncbi:MAG: FtsX-like permease family protein [Gemmatimonadales bacterium]|nr:FtsX-like permease family protein [Gemmatimonadales bacterium]